MAADQRPPKLSEALGRQGDRACCPGEGSQAAQRTLGLRGQLEGRGRWWRAIKDGRTTCLTQELKCSAQSPRGRGLKARQARRITVAARAARRVSASLPAAHRSPSTAPLSWDTARRPPSAAGAVCLSSAPWAGLFARLWFANSVVHCHDQELALQQSAHPAKQSGACALRLSRAFIAPGSVHPR